MAFNFSTLEPKIHKILSAPGTDLATISAKLVRRQLLELDSSLSAEFLKNNKEDVDLVISRVFEKVSAQGVGGSLEETEVPKLKRKQGSAETEDGGAVEVEGKNEDEGEMPQPKKPKKAGKKELSDAELARKLSSEINSRSRRTATKARGSSNGTPRKGPRAKKSAATINSDGSSNDDDDDGTTKRVKSKKKSSGGGSGSAKGGFAKEYALR